MSSSEGGFAAERIDALGHDVDFQVRAGHGRFGGSLGLGCFLLVGRGRLGDVVFCLLRGLSAGVLGDAGNLHRLLAGNRMALAAGHGPGTGAGRWPPASAAS